MKKYIILFFTLILFNNCQKNSIDDLHAQNQSVADSNKVIEPLDFYPEINKMVTRILSRYHYKKIDLNDSLSSVIFDNYIEALDYNKSYFLKSDLDEFEKYRFEFDEDLYLGKLMPAYRIFNVYKTRMNERIDYVLKNLDKEPDFTIDETIKVDREKEPWANSVEELNEIWRKKLKNEALNLKLSGKEWDKTKETLVKRYKNYHKAILQYKSEDVLQLYLNSFADAVDPHSNYLAPRTSENFNIRMKLSLEGIGATLRTDNDFTKVVNIVPGGPAFKADNIHEEDLITGVGQGNEEIVDVIGWRIDDVVDLIRGDKGTTVRLTILRADKGIDSKPDTISIVRDKVKLEEQAAQKKIITIRENDTDFKIGVIEIPSFYVDFEARRNGETDYRSTTRDVRKIIAELEEEKVDGVIVDLRNNGGGALDEAVELTGLFIEDGPVVQVRQSNGDIAVEKDPDPSIAYKGPLAVVINRYSASASEIFSGAIQDYGRGVILGEQSYGKGTVQNLIDLARFVPSAGDQSGQLKLTIAKYYRINGSSTQNLGVIPDVAFPSAVDPNEYGESSIPSALKWDQIQTSQFKKYGDLSSIFPSLIAKHQERILKEPEFNYLMQDIEEYKENKNKTEFSLNENIRKKERDESEEKRKLRDEERKKFETIEIIDKKEVTKKTLKEEDPFLEESGHVLVDLLL
ncbi:MAG: carboxy terminal-processing peptidase, partial [Ignavibacteriae bacterium]|nr:carboxy terminal-processing peptidase [Ignavibacteriota bacterium]